MEGMKDPHSAETARHHRDQPEADVHPAHDVDLCGLHCDLQGAGGAGVDHPEEVERVLPR